MTMPMIERLPGSTMVFKSEGRPTEEETESNRMSRVGQGHMEVDQADPNYWNFGVRMIHCDWLKSTPSSWLWIPGLTGWCRMSLVHGSSHISLGVSSPRKTLGCQKHVEQLPLSRRFTAEVWYPRIGDESSVALIEFARTSRAGQR